MGVDTRLKIGEVCVLKTCCEIEETAAELYRHFGQLFADDVVLSNLWNKIAMEEDDHAEQFRFAVRLHGSGMTSVQTDEYNVTVILSKLKSIFQSVQASPPSPREALRFAIKLEESLAAYHMNAMVHFEDRSLAQLFKAMNGNDQDHVTRLRIKYEELLNDPPVKGGGCHGTPMG